MKTKLCELMFTNKFLNEASLSVSYHHYDTSVIENVITVIVVSVVITVILL